MELSFTELRCKEVVNLSDGRRLGHPIDLVFDTKAKICGIVTPSPKRGWSIRRGEDILIPWRAIVRIGDDVILVNLCDPAHQPPCPPVPPPHPPQPPCPPPCPPSPCPPPYPPCPPPYPPCPPQPPYPPNC